MQQRRCCTFAGCLVILAGIGAIARTQPVSPDRPLALVGGTVYLSPTEQPISNGVVLIESGKIAAVGNRSSVRLPREIQTVDCRGLTIAAGFWNSHVHFLQRKWADAEKVPAADLGRQLQSMLTQFGFTSVFDTWSMWENTRRLRDRIESGEIAGPRIRSTGEAVFPKSPAVAQGSTQMATQAAAWGALGFIPLDKLQNPRVSDSAEAHDAVTKLLDSGVDGIKLYAVTIGRNGIPLPDQAITPLVTEAHKRGRIAFAHPTTTAGLMASLRAGVDVLAHTTPQSGPWDDTVVAAMKQAGVALIPTLALWKYELRHEQVSIGEGFSTTAIGQLRKWAGTGGVVLFGTDVGYMTEYDPAAEYALMFEAGMTFSQILASLTTAPAERFGVSKELGRIAPGFIADLTIVRGDPSKDIRALTDVQFTLRDGRIIYRRSR